MDLLCAFATQANTYKYVRPSLHTEPLISIKKGRHPVVEMLLPSTEKFIPKRPRHKLVQESNSYYYGSKHVRKINLLEANWINCTDGAN